MSTRQPINIDPLVRDALRAHLMTRYAGTGVGYSEFIRRALVRDGADWVPEWVQPDDRWSGDLDPIRETADLLNAYAAKLRLGPRHQDGCLLWGSTHVRDDALTNVELVARAEYRGGHA
jgi:hypothetical protein